MPGRQAGRLFSARNRHDRPPRVVREVLAAAPRPRVVSRLGVGFDTIDIPACTERGIAVMVMNGANDLSVAERAMRLMLGGARRSVDGHNHVRDGGWWPKDGPRMVDLAGRTALVLVHDPHDRPARIAADGHAPARDLKAALGKADVVTLHCPLMPETHHLMDEAAFAAMKPGAILVTTARGRVVKQEAVLTALRSGTIMGFGTDVLEVEPASAGNPLLTMPNVIVSPHSAASTEEGLTRMARFAARNVLDALDGRPDPAMMVNPEILQRRR